MSARACLLLVLSAMAVAPTWAQDPPRHPAVSDAAKDVAVIGPDTAKPFAAYCSEPFAGDTLKAWMFEVANLDTQSVLSQVLDPDKAQAIIDAVRAEIAAEAIEDAELQAYIESLMREIIPFSPRMQALGDDWKLFLTKNPAKYNAMAALGGTFIFDLTYLATLKTEAELVGVLAHEIGHIELAHSESNLILMRLLAEREDFGAIFELVSEGLQPRSSLEERAADIFALRVMVALGYEPLAFPEVFRRTASTPSEPKEGRSFGKFLAEEVEHLQRSHPRDDVRVCHALRQLRAQGLLIEDAIYYRGKTNFEKRIPRSKEQY